MIFTRISTIIVIIFYCFSFASAQSTEVMIKVRDTVSVGVPFTLDIELKNIQGTFKTPDFNGLKMVGGPNTSSSFTMINGETSSKTKYSYYLMAESVGDYTIFLNEMPTGLPYMDEIEAMDPICLHGDLNNLEKYITKTKLRPKTNKK